MSRDPGAVPGEEIKAVESDVSILSYVSLGATGAGKAVEFLTEKAVKKVNKVKEIKDLPNDHWIKGPKYQGVLTGFAAIAGAATVVSDGRQAYVAYQQGDTIKCIYYVAKGVVTTAETTQKFAEISKNVLAFSGKTGRFAKLASDEVGVGLAIAVGTIETGYNIAKWTTTDDPIQKSAYGEKVFSSIIDTGFGVLAVFAPAQVAVFLATWTALNELVFWLGGDEIAYKVAQSPAEAEVFLFRYWISKGVPSVLAEEAYDSVKGRLLEQLAAMNDFNKPFIPVFIDPLL